MIAKLLSGLLIYPPRNLCTTETLSWYDKQKWIDRFNTEVCLSCMRSLHITSLPQFRLRRTSIRTTYVRRSLDIISSGAGALELEAYCMLGLLLKTTSGHQHTGIRTDLLSNETWVIPIREIPWTTLPLYSFRVGCYIMEFKTIYWLIMVSSLHQVLLEVVVILRV